MIRAHSTRLVAPIFFISGATGLVYETVWIRLFALNFGNTIQAMSTVLSVFLGGLALGAVLMRRVLDDRRTAAEYLRLYGTIEILVGVWAALVPVLVGLTRPLLATLYKDGHSAPFFLLPGRALLGALLLLPATVLMGATLPLLAAWLGRSIPDAGRDLTGLYSVNLAGATCGALACGFVLLPGLGFQLTLFLACGMNIAAGGAAIYMAQQEESAPGKAVAPNVETSAAELSPAIIGLVAFLSGWSCLVGEVAWGRLYGLLFGPTATTITLVLATFLLGLTLGGAVAARLRRNIGQWLAGAQLGAAAALGWAVWIASLSPPWIADWVRGHSGDASQLELMKLVLLCLTLLPLTFAFGLTFPLTMRAGAAVATRIGGLYGVNTVGCILGSLAAGWLLVPVLGTERTVLLAGALSLAMGVLLLQRLKARLLPMALAGAVAVIYIVLPRWDMSAMTAGAYKYAPYTSGDVNAGSLVSVNEGIVATVAIRRDAGSTILSIDGKVDASDAGGDMLTEKLLAHLPLLLAGEPKDVCLIGLASGVTAGAALTHPLRSLDVVELAPEVVSASHYFDRVNGKPLEDRRTSLVVNDGRSHLALTSARYDVIISEPSNPWIAGMNNLFTRDFFRLARTRLAPNGILAQWFHTYNMPADDLRSLLAAFTEVFPQSALWKLNDGDILLTGFAGDAKALTRGGGAFPERARRDLAGVGIGDPSLLYDLYVLPGSALARFAAGAVVNTDDFPVLEFHGQRDLHAQTDFSNETALLALPGDAVPAVVAQVRAAIGFEERLALAHVFENAESSRTAFRNYRLARELAPSDMSALAGMDRTATLPEDHNLVNEALGLPPGTSGTEGRIAWARDRAANGDLERARMIFEEAAAAAPKDVAARFNYGVFCMEQKDWARAVAQFEAALQLDSKYLPAYEAMAQTAVERRDFSAAAEWSRRILQIDPQHPTARQSLATLERCIGPGRNNGCTL